jgi:hypothetical protein
VRRWAAAGVAGAALGPAIGGLLTSAFSWRAIFVAQIPMVLLAFPAAIAAALFLPVLLLVDGWSRSPAVAAVTVTAVQVAALAAGPVFRDVHPGTRSGAVAGSVLIAGGLTGLALLPGTELAWTLAPLVLIGLGLGLSVDSLTAAALRDRVPRALHGGWTIAALYAGVVIGLPRDPHRDLHRRTLTRPASGSRAADHTLSFRFDQGRAARLGLNRNTVVRGR